MIAPARPLVLLALLPVALSVGLVVVPDAWPVVVAIDGAIALVALADLCTLPRRKRFRVGRQCGRVLSLREPHRVTLEIQNRSRRTLDALVRDDALPELEVTPAELELVLPAKSRKFVEYRLVPGRRGAYALEHVHLKVVSRLRLWTRVLKLPFRSDVAVYPDLRQLSRYALYARLNRLSMLGVRRTRRVGQDNEFERLREYTPDDNFRSIDWRATARRRELIVKDYQSNHSQRVVFLIDCGRMMVNEHGGLSLLDHSLDAMLMLAYVALHKGDQVGVLSFSDSIHHYLEPAGGRRQLNRIVHAVHDQFPRLVESRYDAAFTALAQRCRKRTLVVLVTNVIDDVNAEQIGRHLDALSGRHLPLAVLLKDHDLTDRADFPIDRFAGREALALTADERSALYEAAVAVDLLEWRRKVLRDFRATGAMTLDVFPEELTVPLINQYLQIKAAHLL